MTKGGKFTPGQSGNSATMFQPGNKHRWIAGVSGNPTGKSRYRAQFDEAFNQALITQGSAEEAAKLLWEAARAGEAWAVQNLCQRFAPQTQNLRLTHEVNHDEIDYAKLTDGQLEQLDALLEQAAVQSAATKGGEGPT
jgi:hypothetical protein